MIIVGWTGGIASGKTFCSDYLAARYSVNVVDADLIAREVVSAGGEAIRALEVAFGSSIITIDGSLNRKKMREMMLADANVRAQLNAIVHPRVRQIMLNKLENYKDKSEFYQVMSVPLLFENGLEQYADMVVVIDISEAEQIARLKLRDHMSGKAINQMLNAQMKRTDRLARANFIIDNSGTQQQTQQQLDNLHEQLCKLSAINT